MRLVNSEVVTPAESFNLTTLAAVKLEYNITDTDQDVYLEAQIRRASSDIAAYCRRVFARQTYQDTFAADARDWRRRISHSLFLANRPAVAGTISVLRDNQTLVDGTDYKAATDQGRLYNVTGWGTEIVVTYDAGWILPGSGGSGGSTLPDAIEGAAIAMVLGMRQAGRLAWTDRDPFLRSETVEGIGRKDYAQTPIGSSSGGSAVMGGMAQSVAYMLAPYVIPIGA